MADEKPEKRPLSDSEIQALRDELAAAEKRTWLRRLVQTGAAWTAGVLIGTSALIDAGLKLVEWATKK